MVSSAIHACPLCHATPAIAGRFRFQVRCDCGACGPKRPTPHEAIRRWASVVHYMKELRRSLLPGEVPETQAA
jgi:hypothetical protein